MKHILLSLICICFVWNLQAQTRSPKRGVSFNFTNDADLKALQPGTTWFYNWGVTPNNVTESYNSIYGYEFCPMLWGGNWNSTAIRNYVKAHPDCKYLLLWNEPNFRDQANLTPRQAADKFPEAKALAQELGLKMISPACNYSGWAEYGTPAKWFDEFFRYIDIDEFDGVAIHSYMGWASATAGYVKEYINKYNKPVWLTEFCAWDNFQDNQGGTALVQRREMIDLLEYLETEPMLAKYAWFIPRRDEFTKPAFPYMELLTNTGGKERGILTETGLVWTYMSSYDKEFFHDVDACIEAEHYISKTKGIYMEQTSDEAGVINIYDYSEGRELTYNINIPTSGEYAVRLRMLSNAEAALDITSNAGTVSQVVASTGNTWENKEFKLNLQAGKQELTFKLTSGSIKLNYFVVTNNGATPDPTPNPDGMTPPLPPPAGDNLAFNRPVESSSTDDRLSASLVTDGKTGTNNRWESKHGVDNKWILIDLEQTIAVKDIIINWEGAYASQYNVEVSVDKSEWEQIYNTTTGEAGEERITLTDVKNARYIKINCIKRGTQYGFSIFEVEVYGALPNDISVSDVPELNIYPNPIERILSVQTDDKNASITISDINGRELYSADNVSSTDMSGFASGIYILTVRFSNGATVNKKIVKK